MHRPSIESLPPAQAARRARLHYGNDDRPGIRRISKGQGFRYVSSRGVPLRNRTVLRRIKALAIPPAWKEVWICPDVRGHLQATGRDARNRKQYRYHPQWNRVREENKFHRLLAFGRALPKLRRQVRADLRSPGLNREKVLATLVRLMDLSAIRIGNETYAVQNHSYGLTTLLNRHATVQGGKIILHFRGKSGQSHRLLIRHPALARIVKKCRDLPGQELFQWVAEDGTRHRIHSGDLNDYISRIAGEEFTSKDFRTWSGSVLALRALSACAPAGSETEIRSVLNDALRQVAQRLGNTLAVCRKAYVHPAVLQGYRDGVLPRGSGKGSSGLRREEAALLKLLQAAS